jgi:hypothetical protein
MQPSTLYRYALSLSAAAALLAGCGGSQPPIGASGAMPQLRVGTPHAGHGTSWMLPEAKGVDLLYVSYPQGPGVYVYSYPKGQEVGEITGFTSGYYPQGLCTDRSGNIFVTAVQGASGNASAIYEYAHGGNTISVTPKVRGTLIQSSSGYKSQGAA